MDFIMLKMNTGEKWRRRVGFCISYVRYLVLGNGKSCGLFGNLRGFRIETSLLVMEALSRMIDRAVLGGPIKGFKVAAGDVGIVSISYFYLQMIL